MGVGGYSFTDCQGSLVFITTLYDGQSKMHVLILLGEFEINPLSRDIKMHILITDLHTFLRN